MTGMPAARWGGYPRLFTEKTSSLLNEALQMLHRAKDIRERRWLQMYVQRLATLSGDLERSTTNFGSPSTVPSPQRRSQQQTVPTTGQISPPPSPSASKMKTRTTTQGSVREVARELGKPEEVTKPNFLNEYDPLAGQLHQQAAHESRLRVTTETYSLDAGGHVPMRPTTPVVADDMSRLIRKRQTWLLRNGGAQLGTRRRQCVCRGYDVTPLECADRRGARGGGGVRQLCAV
ncbi:hypothetical protein ISCGN_003631 [Ixodes scapularis]